MISTKHSTVDYRNPNTDSDFKLTAESVRRALEGSLKRLKRDCIDVYLVHWPSSDIDMEDVINMMVKLKGQGKLRAIGVSNFQEDELKAVRQYGEIDVLQPPYSLLWRCLEDDVFTYCAKAGISLVVYSPLANGILTDAFIENKRKPLSDTQSKQILLREPYFDSVAPVLDAVEKIAGKYHCAISQVAIAWMLAKRDVASMILGN